MAIVDDVLREAGFTDSAIRDVKSGRRVHYGGSLDPPASDREISVKLAFHVRARLDTARDIFLRSPKKKEYDPTVESLGMIAVDGGMGSLEDFRDIELSNDGALERPYRSASSSPGTNLNLSADEIPHFASCETRDEVEDALRRILLNRYRAYRHHGLDGIKPYARRNGREFSPGDELRSQIAADRTLPTRSPTLRAYAMEYPNNPPDGYVESYFWVSSIIDGTTTISLVHRMGVPLHDRRGRGYAYMERHFYVSRSHNCLQGIGVALEVDDGTVVLYCTRTSTDQVGGFGSTAKRAVGNRIMGGRMAENFERARVVMAKAAAAMDDEELDGG